MRTAPQNRDVDELLSFGVVNLDKPPGPSAHQVVAWLRDRLGVGRAAHAGTLDPKVTGCLPVLTGDATRMAQVFDASDKAYIAVLELHGHAEDLDVLSAFEGPILQKPPRKSAVKRRLRTRTIHRLDVLERDERRALLRVECESGTYVRKLCHDLGLAVGTGAHMGDLRRAETVPFDDTDLVTMHDLTDAMAFYEDGDEDPIREVVAPAERALTHLPSVTIAPNAAREVANGAPVYAPGVIDAADAEQGALIACYTPNGSAVCLGRLVGDPDAGSGTVVDTERVLV
ncbi:RNA-guided pseudouridylation complex pseudouridine synthase subunit Cbf5 [Halocatena pleomorpha]|uniref:Probable tRNA pseudouridine synthase B n=1 Tax=Halocatena pleomorpha TaxID=1785090 RepID=A0A3P3RD40_9EURY|nr:RNA-guided pseudouridylation complex pseudouridine synthase subunit Cbf5 [Halocatena pleomorpha]RRJ30383.1 RNA-guided pseudouridylation complex pseudouridine synthase subunit Cbf5 [Halocatena pleomorpha]